MINDVNDAVILTARLCLATLFLIFGWRMLRDYSGTVSQIVQLGGPMPVVAAAVTIFMELPVAFAAGIGALARLSALLMVLYTLGTAFMGHRYWTMSSADRVDRHGWVLQGSQHHGAGGFLLLYITWCGEIFGRCNVRHRRAMICE
ncbi:MAG: DoxX family protein [Steroidobacteraceae bacterium]